MLAVLVLAAWPFLRERPEFTDLPDVLVGATLVPVDQASPEGWALHGAWEVEADDPRVAGMSGLACAPFGPLDIVTDTGSRLQLQFPEQGTTRASMEIASLRGIGDAEAIAYSGGATLIAEELRHRLWIFDARRGNSVRDLPRRDGVANWSVEALLPPGGDAPRPIAVTEQARLAYDLGDAIRPIRVSGADMWITGATRHPDGRGIVLMRKLGPLGFSASVATASFNREGLAIDRPVSLPLPFNANAEGICAEPREEGLTRLWIVTDDNGLGALSQRLVAWDVPDAKWPEAPE
ncbi:esterase-like activity of phytase family protein [Sphingomicrobium clamense]|uniref:Esterase-like activity of phytase family protein n=1 Tax=Sphingomicrobium clamense TaxID=2851013 RepID=A0ABS6V3Q0_9SPHN|nr:esterase-like activity of phytase family protein [Sphingomicrobium sp. B8]MBW0144169.1 esterase-like activity of phytase family protein [Sphingomicrobium sp. B8]